jgi:hypothetical protein
VAHVASPLNLLFAGVTTSPAREFVAAQIDGDKHKRVILPCVGRWAVPTAAVADGIDPKRMEASDLSLFSTLIGYLADPRHSIEELALTVPDEYGRFVEDAADDVEFAAGIMLVIKWITTPPKNLYMMEFRRDLWLRLDEYRESLTAELREQVALLHGCRYDIRDVRTVFAEMADADAEDAFTYVNLPGYKGGYTKMYGDAEEQLWTSHLPTTEFDPSEAQPTLDLLTESKSRAIAYIHHGDDAMPVGWQKVMAISARPDRVDYVIANQDLPARYTAAKFPDGPPTRYPVFDDSCEITPETEVRFLTVDKHTGLHYRDLFVHRLGQTKAERYVLMLLDGRVVTSFGLHLQHLRLRRTEYLYEVFGISVTSRRYARLGKLFMLALTCGDARRWVLASMPELQMCDPRGIQTSSPTLHAEGKTDRSVLKLVSREPNPEGGFHLIYKGDFREDSFADVIEMWLDKWGHISRKGWTPELVGSENG